MDFWNNLFFFAYTVVSGRLGNSMIYRWIKSNQNIDGALLQVNLF